MTVVVEYYGGRIADRSKTIMGIPSDVALWYTVLTTISESPGILEKHAVVKVKGLLGSPLQSVQRIHDRCEKLGLVRIEPGVGVKTMRKLYPTKLCQTIIGQMRSDGEAAVAKRNEENNWRRMTNATKEHNGHIRASPN